MKKTTLLLLNFSLSLTLFGQYDFIVTNLLPDTNNVPINVEYSLNQVDETVNNQKEIFYELSNPLVDLSYHPKGLNLECGYLKINDKVFKVKGGYPHPSWGCDLDENSFELSRFDLGDRRYIILTAINWGSGSSTKIVFCHLFDITDIDNIHYYSLWSMYGSSHCFGDYNNDGNIDFLQIRYAPEAKDNDTFKLNLSTIDEKKFKPVGNKFIIFRREYRNEGLPKIIVTEDNW